MSQAVRHILLLWVLPLLLSADIREIHIIHTTDIHAQFSPRYEGDGGWLAAATVIRRLRQQYGKETTLLIDTGDNTQGTTAASLTRGFVGMQPLHALGYDAWIPGNHEFDYGLEQFCQFMSDADSIALCGNLALNGRPPFKGWTLFRRNGAAIAVIGLTSSFMKNWQLPQDAERLSVTPGPAVLRKLLPEILAARPDAIVLATHQGWAATSGDRSLNELSVIADQFPEIDLILGAHSHRTLPGVKIGHRTWYVQPGAHGTHVALATLTVDTEAHKVLSISSSLLPVEKGTPQDEELKTLVNPSIQKEIAERKRPLKGYLGKAALSRGTSGSTCATSELIAKAIAECVGATVVFHGKMTNKDVPPGPLTADILYKLIPYDNTIVTMELTPDQIRQVAEEQYKWKRHYSFSGIYGARFQFDHQGKGTLLGFGTDGLLKPEDAEKRVRVAVHSHAAAGSGRFTVLRKLVGDPACHAVNHPITTRRALEDYLSAHPGLIITPFPWQN